MTVAFKIYKNDELVAEEEFDRDIIKIGRLSSAHIRLDDEKVSRIHAVVEVSADGRISIIDMGSTQGTFVNGQRVNKIDLNPGDEILVGDTRLVLVGDKASGVAEAGDATDHEEETRVEVPRPASGVVEADAEEPPDLEATEDELESMAEGDHEVPVHRIQQDETPAEGQKTADAVTQKIPVQSPSPAPAQEPTDHADEESESFRVALPPPAELGELDDDETITPANWTLEVRHLWVDRVLEVNTYRPEKKSEEIVVGESEDVDFLVPAEFLPDRTFKLARLTPQGVQVCFASNMKGEVIDRAGNAVSLEQLVSAGKVGRDPDQAGAYVLTLTEDSVVTVRMGNVGFRFRMRSRPKGYITKLADRLDYTYLNTILLVFFIYAGLVATFHLRPEEVTTTEEELYKVPDRFVQFILTRPKPQKKDLVFLEKLRGDVQAKGKSAERYKGREGKMGLKGRPDTGKRSAVRAIKPDDREVVGNRGLLAVLGSGGPQGLSTVMGGTGLGGELEGAIGNMFGPTVGNSGGFGGLGLKGTGPGGGGMSSTTIGVGRLGTRGRGGGAFGYGTGVAKIRRRGERNVNISVGRPIIMGSLSMEIIRRVIRSHRDQIKYCYSKELTRNPNLSGKVAVKFIISPKGYVSQATVSQSTLNNSAVESCITQKIRTWKFPEPKGGGIVIVNYPFILKAS